MRTNAYSEPVEPTAHEEVLAPSARNSGRLLITSRRTATVCALDDFVRPPRRSAIYGHARPGRHRVRGRPLSPLTPQNLLGVEDLSAGGFGAPPTWQRS